MDHGIATVHIWPVMPQNTLYASFHLQIERDKMQLVRILSLSTIAFCLGLKEARANSTSHQCEDASVGCAQFIEKLGLLSDPSLINPITDQRYFRLGSLDSQKCNVLVKKPMTFDKAADACTEAGGHLAWVYDNKEAVDLVHNAQMEAVAFAPPETSGVWVGLTIKAGQSDVETVCSGLKQDGLKWVSGMEPTSGASADSQISVCKGTSETGFCANQKADHKLPFYCQTDSKCPIKTVKDCNNFKAKLQKDGVTADEVLPLEQGAGLPKDVGKAHCIMLVNKAVTSDKAQKLCGDAGGRLAWANKGKTTLDTMLNFAQQKTATPDKQDSAWIGLQRVFPKGDYTTDPWWSQRWHCPAAKGSKHFKVLSPYYAIMKHNSMPKPTFKPPDTDPSEQDLEQGHLKVHFIPRKGQWPIAFDSYKSSGTVSDKPTELPFFCEAAVRAGGPLDPDGPRAQEKEGGSTTGVIVGVTLGSFFLLLFILAVVIATYSRARNKGAENAETGSVGEQSATAKPGDVRGPGEPAGPPTGPPDGAAPPAEQLSGKDEPSSGNQ